MEAVVSEALVGDPRHRRRRDGPAERRRVPEARVVDQDEQHVRRALRRRRRHEDRPIGDGRVQGSADRATEVRIRDRQHRAIGAELPHRLAERLLQCAHALLVALDNRAEHGARERLLDTEPLLVVEDRDDPGRPRRQVLADLVVKLLLDLVVGESADHPARDRPDCDRREHRRREQAHREPDAAAPACSLAAEVVARLLHGDAAVFLVRDEDHALDLDFLLLDERDERLEVLRRLVDVRVTGNEDIGGCLSHQGSPFEFRPLSRLACGVLPTMAEARSPNIAQPRVHPGEGEPRVMRDLRDCRTLLSRRPVVPKGGPMESMHERLDA